MRFIQNFGRRLKKGFHDALQKAPNMQDIENFKFNKIGKKPRLSIMRFGKKEKTLAALSFFAVIFIIGLYYFYPARITAEFGKEFQMYAGQEAEIDGMQLKLERSIIPLCESGAECKSIGSVIMIGSQGKMLESQMFKGVEKEFFVVDKKIGIILTDAGGYSAKFIATTRE
jgi:hypothetical protein